MNTANTAYVRAHLVDILRREMFVTKDPIVDDDELIGDLGLDSTNIAIGLVAIEQQLRVVLCHQDVIGCSDFGTLVSTVADANNGDCLNLAPYPHPDQ